MVQQLKYGDNVPLTVLRHYDGNNVERVQKRSYRFEIDGDVATPGLMQRLGGRNEASEEKAMAQSLNSAISGDMAGTGAIQAGQKTTLVFNEQQMQALLQQTQTAATANKIGASPLALLVGNGQPSDTEQFAIALARNVGGQPAAFAERLQRIADGADGRFDGRLQRIDADVAPRPAAATRQCLIRATLRIRTMGCCSNAPPPWGDWKARMAPRRAWTASVWHWDRWWPRVSMGYSASTTCCSGTTRPAASWSRARSIHRRTCAAASTPRRRRKRRWKPACSACRHWDQHPSAMLPHWSRQRSRSRCGSRRRVDCVSGFSGSVVATPATLPLLDRKGSDVATLRAVAGLS